MISGEPVRSIEFKMDDAIVWVLFYDPPDDRMPVATVNASKCKKWFIGVMAVFGSLEALYVHVPKPLGANLVERVLAEVRQHLEQHHEQHPQDPAQAPGDDQEPE